MKVILLLLLLVSACSVAISQSVVMKIAGITAPEGEEVIAFETGDTTAPATASSGSGGTVTIARFEFVKIKKLVAASTSELFKRSIGGTHTPDVTFQFNDSNSQSFYQISLKDVTLTHFSYLSPECAGCTKLFHQVWFDFVKIEATDVASGNVIKYDRSKRAFY